MFLGLAVAAAARWFPTDFRVPYFGSDTIYPLNPMMNASWLFSMWDPSQFGQVSMYPALLPFLSFFSFAHAAGLNLGEAQHMYEWLVAFAGSAAVAILARRIYMGKHQLAVAALAGVIYLLAPSAVALPLGWWATVALPLMILAVHGACVSTSISRSARFGILGLIANVLLLNDVPNYQMAAVLGLWIVVFAVAAFVATEGVKRRSLVARLLTFGLVSFGCIAPLIAAIALGLLPNYSSSMAITAVKVGSYGTYGDLGHTTVPSVLTLLSEYPLQWQNAAIIAASVVVPAFAALGAIACRRSWPVAAITMATIFSIVITIGPNDPVGPMYRWMIEHVPGAVAFRTVGKVHVFIALGYALLAPAGVMAIAAGRSWLWAAVGAVMTAAAIAGWPIWYGMSFRTPLSPLTQPRVVPGFYVSAGAYLEHRDARALIYPDQGYTQEMLPNGDYFGPSLATYSFPRTTVFSRSGVYGAPAAPQIATLYGMFDRIAQAPRIVLAGAGGIVPGYRWVVSAMGRRSGVVRVTIRAVPRTNNSYLVAALRLGGSGVHGLRAALDGAAFPEEAQPDEARVLPLRRRSSMKTTAALTIAFMKDAKSNGVLGAHLSVVELSLRQVLPTSFYRQLLHHGIQYFVFDGAANQVNVPALRTALTADPNLEAILSDNQGRVLYRIAGNASMATALGGRYESPLPFPQYAYGFMKLSFGSANHARAVLLRQNYSPLWIYAIRHDGQTTIVRGKRGAQGSQTLIPLPKGTSFSITGIFLPQLLLVLQYCVFAGLVIWLLLGLARDAMHRIA